MNLDGILSESEHPLNISFIDFTFEISHFDKSGRDFNDEQFSNILSIILILEIFHLDISGIDINDLQLLNIPPTYFEQISFRYNWQ